MASPDPAPVRIGLIGAGAIMRLSHAPMINRSEAARLVGVFDRDRARAEQLAGDFAIPFHTTELAALLARPDLDAVVVATPNAHLPEAVLAAAAAG